MGPIYTDHALQRIKERFPNIDVASYYFRARKPTKKQKSLIRKTCPQSMEKYMNNKHIFLGRYLRLSMKFHGQQRIVFVVQCNGLNNPESIVTVFEFNSKEN